MTKYSPAAQKIIHDTMEEFSDGKLRSGQSNKKVTDRDQAIAIGISKARQKNLKTPHKHED
jgi:hypothetical protein